MAKYDEWKIFKWHCPNCGTLVTGFKNDSRSIKGECSRCKASMVRIRKTPTHETIEVFAQE